MVLVGLDSGLTWLDQGELPAEHAEHAERGQGGGFANKLCFTLKLFAVLFPSGPLPKSHSVLAVLHLLRVWLFLTTGGEGFFCGFQFWPVLLDITCN